MGWGRNEFGQATVPTNVSDVVAIAAGRNYSMGLRADGTVIGWGEVSAAWTNAVSGFHDIVAIEAFYYSGIFLHRDGRVSEVTPDGGLLERLPADLTNAVAVACGTGQGMAVRAGGSVVTWGSSNPLLNVPSGLTNVIAVACGAFHNVALTGEGRVFAWGGNEYGQVDVPPGLHDVVAIDAGWEYTLALRRNGTVVAWGENRYNQLNIPTSSAAKTMAMAAGGFHNMVLFETGRLFSSGQNGFGQTTGFPALSNVVQIAAGTYHSIALLNDGRPFMPRTYSERTAFVGSAIHLDGRATGPARPKYQWSFEGAALPNETNAFLTLSNTMPAQAGLYSVTAANGAAETATAEIRLEVVDGSPWIAVEAPANPVTFLGSQVVLQGSVQGSRPLAYQWFHDGIALPDATNADLVLPAMTRGDQGEYELRATNSLGTATSSTLSLGAVPVALWGGNRSGQTELFPGLSNVVDVSAGVAFGIGLTADGRVMAWGQNDRGQTNVPASATNIVAIAAGRNFGLALTEVGTVIHWGDSIGMNYLALSNVVSIAGGSGRGLALLSDGTVRGFGTSSAATNIPPTVTNIVAVACSVVINFALTHDGRVLTWGGTSSSGTHQIPEDLTNAVDFAIGLSAGLAVRETGNIVAWGSNEYGELSVPPVMNAVQVASGYFHAMALLKTGQVVAWGGGTEGETLVPAGLSRVSRIAAGDQFGLAVIDEDFERFYELQLFEPMQASQSFSVAVETRRGFTYWLETTTNLVGAEGVNSGHWRLVYGLVGNGRTMTLSDRSTGVGHRFYRVRRQ